MGINYILKNSKHLKNLLIDNNYNLKLSFYTTLMFWGAYDTKTSLALNGFLLGKRYGFCILNAEHHAMLLKKAAKLVFELKKNKQKILFVNESSNQTYDGIIKFLAFRSLEPHIVGKWPNGLLIKKTRLSHSIFFFKPDNTTFSLKEANKVGIPIISLTGLNRGFSKTMYPIVCNNMQADSIFFNSFILSNCIIEGRLFYFIKKKCTLK